MSTPIKPLRIQRSRRPGSKLVSPNGLPVKCVTRPLKFCNPFKVMARVKPGRMCRGYISVAKVEDSLERFRQYAKDKLLEDSAWLEELKGCNLACWCPLDKPCHADVLLEFANREVKS